MLRSFLATAYQHRVCVYSSAPVLRSVSSRSLSAPCLCVYSAASVLHSVSSRSLSASCLSVQFSASAAQCFQPQPISISLWTTLSLLGQPCGPAWDRWLARGCAVGPRRAFERGCVRGWHAQGAQGVAQVQRSPLPTPGTGGTSPTCGEWQHWSTVIIR